MVETIVLDKLPTVAVCTNPNCARGFGRRLKPRLQERPCRECEEITSRVHVYSLIECRRCGECKYYIDPDNPVRKPNIREFSCDYCTSSDVQIKNFKLHSEKTVLEREQPRSAVNAPEHKQLKSTTQTTTSQNKTRQKTQQIKGMSNNRASGSKISLSPPLNPLRSETPDTRISQTKTNIPSTQNGVKKQKGVFSAPAHKNKQKQKHDVSDLNNRNAPVESKNYPWKNKARAGLRMINPDTKLESNLQNRKCKECGKQIAEHTIMARPDTKYCSEHIQLNETILPTQDIIGSRQDFKKDSARNKFRAGLPKKL